MNKIAFSPIDPHDLINQIKDSIKSEFSALKSELINDHIINKNNTEPNSDELISLEETAEYFDVAKTTIHYWRKKQLLPKTYRKGRRVYFKKQDLIKSLESLSSK